MIELRWIDRYEPVPDWPGVVKNVRVLQYRNLEIAGFDEDGGAHFLNRWLDWQDVPLVTDKDAP